jgi:hypothetical protein
VEGPRITRSHGEGKGIGHDGPARVV